VVRITITQLFCPECDISNDEKERTSLHLSVTLACIYITPSQNQVHEVTFHPSYSNSQTTSITSCVHRFIYVKLSNFLATPLTDTMTRNTAPHRLQFGIELEMVVRPNPAGLKALREFSDSINDNEAYNDHTLGGGRDSIRKDICLLLICLLNSSGLPTNQMGEVDYTNWTIDTDPTICD
jgi:hypothetical protein